MGNPFEWFDQTYVCTLPESTGRQEFLKSQFERMSFPHVEWIVGESVHKDNFTLKHLATTDSHIEAYAHALYKGYKKILVMEDDCEYLPEKMDHLGDALTDLEKMDGWEVCYLGAHLYGETLATDSPYLRKPTLAVSLHSYAISEKGMKFLLLPEFAELYKISPLDLVICNTILPNKSGYVVKPMVAKQHPGWSDIERQNKNYDNMFKDGDKWLEL